MSDPEFELGDAFKRHLSLVTATLLIGVPIVTNEGIDDAMIIAAKICNAVENYRLEPGFGCVKKS